MTICQSGIEKTCFKVRKDVCEKNAFKESQHGNLKDRNKRQLWKPRKADKKRRIQKYKPLALPLGHFQPF